MFGVGLGKILIGMLCECGESVVFWVIFSLFVLDLLGFGWGRGVRLVEYRDGLFCCGVLG